MSSENSFSIAALHEGAMVRTILPQQRTKGIFGWKTCAHDGKMHKAADKMPMCRAC